RTSLARLPYTFPEPISRRDMPATRPRKPLRRNGLVNVNGYVVRGKPSETKTERRDFRPRRLSPTSIDPGQTKRARGLVAGGQGSRALSIGADISSARTIWLAESGLGDVKPG